jgi:tetratricopeptide (TPR) repeat protein
VFLLRAVRDLTLWSKLSGSENGSPFSARAHGRVLDELMRAEIDDALRPQLMIISEVLRHGHKMPVEDLAATALRVSTWADENRLPNTAIAFGQAAALLLPQSAEYAFLVGRLCRRSGQVGRAETWYRRALGLSRRSRDSRSFARAWMGIGHLLLSRGDYVQAEKAFQRAFQRARRAGLRDVRAEALHDLFGVSVEAGRILEAEHLARKAVTAYGTSHERLPVLAHDVAGFWLAQGFFTRSLLVFRAVAKHIARPSERLQVLGSIARAAGGARDWREFVHAWVDAWEIIDSDPGVDCASYALLNLAYGAAYLEDWERVELSASLSRDLACKRKKEEVRAQAEHLLRLGCDRKLPEEVTYSIPKDHPEVYEAADALAGVLVRKIEVCAGTGGLHPRIRC